MKRRAPLITALAIALVVVGVYVGWKVLKRQRTLDTRIAERHLADASSAGLAFAPVEEWPAWRGPRGDGISREALPDAWPAGGPRELWSAEVGLGYSSPIAAGGGGYLFRLDNKRGALPLFYALPRENVLEHEGHRRGSGGY